MTLPHMMRSPGETAIINAPSNIFIFHLQAILNINIGPFLSLSTHTEALALDRLVPESQPTLFESDGVCRKETAIRISGDGNALRGTRGNNEHGGLVN